MERYNYVLILEMKRSSNYYLNLKVEPYVAKTNNTMSARKNKKDFCFC